MDNPTGYFSFLKNLIAAVEAPSTQKETGLTHISIFAIFIAGPFLSSTVELIFFPEDKYMKGTC